MASPHLGPVSSTLHSRQRLAATKSWRPASRPAAARTAAARTAAARRFSTAAACTAGAHTAAASTAGARTAPACTAPARTAAARIAVAARTAVARTAPARTAAACTAAARTEAGVHPRHWRGFVCSNRDHTRSLERQIEILCPELLDVNIGMVQSRVEGYKVLETCDCCQSTRVKAAGQRCSSDSTPHRQHSGLPGGQLC
eukprot:3940957-Rhodomonas_salina.2